MLTPLPVRVGGAVAAGRARRVRFLVGTVALLAVPFLLADAVDPAELAGTARTARRAPAVIALPLALYLGAFVVRAALWTRVLPALSFGHALAGLLVALAGNHLLPLRLGEALRVTTVARRTRMPLAALAGSTIALRAADLLAVAAIAAVLAPGLVPGLVPDMGADMGADIGGTRLVPIVAAAALGAGALVFFRRRARAAVARGTLVVTGAAAAWLLEAPLVVAAAHWAGLELSLLDALLVTAVTMLARVVAVAPGGVGTYEAAAVVALTALGAEPGAALAAAVAAHVVKTLFALAAGAVAAVVPQPGLLGRWRLPRHRPARPPAADAGAAAPVVLFLPAHDEAATVANVVARVPGSVGGHPVVTLVVDDGSTDGTAAVAERAGARVVSMGTNQGLGAAVRRGFREAVALRPAAVAFCDADGEYDPAELARVVAPILAGDADYVVASRFAGCIERMLPHRRLGNRVLTTVLRFVARTAISDGQSGYRALSPAAAAAAEIVHDYNYAQVLTLDLLAKGFRYAEVPASYAFRRQGRSFIRLVPYLRRVLPAMHRELNAA